MFAQDAYALSKLAFIIGRYDDSIMLKKRGDDMKNRIQNTLWHKELGIYANRLLNGTFYPRISPTSFYPMQAKVATDGQADLMITKWLLNSTRFCIARDGDFKGNNDANFDEINFDKSLIVKQKSISIGHFLLTLIGRGVKRVLFIGYL